VLTPSGAKAIEDLVPGDIVYSETGKEIKVLKTFVNGPKEVGDLTYRGQVWGSFTENHVFLTTDGKKATLKAAKDIGKYDCIMRTFVRPRLGDVRVKEAYSLAALLGDGCSKQGGNKIYVSSSDDRIPAKIANQIGVTFKKQGGENHTWILENANIPYYKEWCKGRYAHEKTVDIEVLKTWDRQSLVEFVAGLLDTDGTVYPAKDHVSLSLNMQAKEVVDAFDWAVFRLWQVKLNRTIDARDKYKNGPVHVAYTRATPYVELILNELGVHLESEQKKWKYEYSSIGGKRTKLEYVGLKWGSNKRIEETYDIHVDSETNLYLLSNGLITHNSGKSQLAARETAWVLTETHPYWKRSPQMGTDKLQLLVLGRVGKHIEEILWRKISGFLDMNDVHIQRTGGTLQKVTYRPNGNTILFISHHNTNEAREKSQGYTADYVWLDELPGDVKLIEELHRRIMARDGRFLATFTPKTFNKGIKELVDNARPPLAKKYQFSMLDNPIYSPTQKQEILQSLETYPEGYRKMILHGDWFSGEGAVYQVPDSFYQIPEGYHPSWRHVESVDPALSSKFGVTVWAENPVTSNWTCVKSEYLTDIPDPNDMFFAAQRITSDLNIVRRICDPEANWYINLAKGKGVFYTGPNKVNRKGEMIKNLQTAITTGRINCAPWCDILQKELETCQWSQTANDQIINHHSFHCLDTAQYFVDLMPKPLKVPIVQSWEQEMRSKNEARKKKEKIELTKGNWRRTWKLRRY
jgi:phage terminase large subunit-like protein